ncbi:gluconokinase [Rhodoferax sp. GW822-FHT02A01]|uniref:gluconokinase n=1 Tax=Rhodoferax sp. GW822-FHT02A01 TaxID=3141537 RepID=UPI00315D737C
MIVIMGVAGCGKSSLAQALARAESCALIEGDDFHSPASREKMSKGIALTDEDRAGWLSVLAAEIQKHTEGVVLTCSALKKSYRDRLRQSVPTLQFAFLEIGREEAQRRVVARAASHFFNAGLVDNQFATLESPVGEAGVIRLDAAAPLESLQTQVSQWLHRQAPV